MKDLFFSYNHVFGFVRERQLQLEELTKELKRVTEETDVLKFKLKSMKSSNQVPTETRISIS